MISSFMLSILLRKKESRAMVTGGNEYEGRWMRNCERSKIGSKKVFLRRQVEAVVVLLRVRDEGDKHRRSEIESL